MSQPTRRIQVIKRPGGRSPNWYLRYWEPDQRTGKNRERWKSTGTTVRKRAEQQRRDLERRLEAPTPHDSRTQWSAFRDTYLEIQAAKKSPATVESYRKSLNIFGDAMGLPDIASITVAGIEDFAKKRLDDGAAPATANRDLRHLKAALRWAARRSLITVAPDFHGLFVREPDRFPTVIPEEHFLALVRVTQDDPSPTRKRSGDWWRMFLYVSYYLG